MIDSERLLDRFLRYVQIDTTASAEAQAYPSSPGQMALGRLLVEELRAMGLDHAEQDEHGIVMATLPSTSPAAWPTVAFCAHLDTSPETKGGGVRPQVIRSYQGGEIKLCGAAELAIRPEECAELAQMHGRTIITSDGTTLLGADDKAGVAAIMEAAAYLSQHPEVSHGPLRLVFTCDEEIGRGVDHLDLGKISAAVCYTLDGQGADRIDVETFSADLAVVSVRGVNIHPSIAKGRMTNAVRAAAALVARLPRAELAPETTEGREGFLHPYEISGGVGEVRVKVLLRDFQTPRLSELAALVQQAAAETMAEFPQARIAVDVKPQYRNLGDGLRRAPRAVALAEEALRRLGRQAQRTFVRGGTDGARLTEMGLPCPNLSTGQHNPHSPLEWACLEEMAAAAEWIIALAEVWAEPQA